MTERSESERAELVAIAGQIDIFIKYGTNAIFEPDDAKKIASALRSLAAQDHGGADAGVREAAKEVGTWLRGALDCKEWHWDADQYEAAEDAYKALQAALSKPAPVAANASAEARLREALEKIAGSHFERIGHCQTDAEDVPDMTAEEAMLEARKALSAHPLASDCDKQGERLREALNVATNIIMANAPGDSRAVSDIEVALCAASCGDLSEPVMAVIREVHLSQRSHAGEPTESEGGVESDTHSQRGRLSHVGSAKVQRPETSLAGIESGPSDRTADVTVEDIAPIICEALFGIYIANETAESSISGQSRIAARALLDAFRVGSRP